MSDYLALAVMAVIVGFFVYAMAPPRWQTPLGLLIIVVAVVPAGLAGITLLSKPAVLIPAAFLLGIFLTQKS